VDLYVIAQTIYDFLQGGPGLLLFFLYLVVVGLPFIMLHEFGHALVAVQRLGEEVEVAVGNVIEFAQFRLGQVNVSLHALQGLHSTAGSASFDASRARAEDVFWIAAAGPIVSAGCMALGVLLYSSAPPDGFVHDLAWMTVFVNLWGVLNVIPFRLQDRRSGPAHPSDGRLALDALRVIRELR
jgi:hypothetical protein